MSPVHPPYSAMYVFSGLSLVAGGPVFHTLHPPVKRKKQKHFFLLLYKYIYLFHFNFYSKNGKSRVGGFVNQEIKNIRLSLLHFWILAFLSCSLYILTSICLLLLIKLTKPAIFVGLFLHLFMKILVYLLVVISLYF